MRLSFLIPSILTLTISMTSSLQAACDDREPVYKEGQKIIMVSPDRPRFVIKLKSNPSTGYTWKIREYDQSMITLKDREAIGPGGIGAPEDEYWEFKVRRHALQFPNTTRIKFEYLSPSGGKDRQALFRVIIVPRF